VNNLFQYEAVHIDDNNYLNIRFHTIFYFIDNHRGQRCIIQYSHWIFEFPIYYFYIINIIILRTLVLPKILHLDYKYVYNKL